MHARDRLPTGQPGHEPGLPPITDPAAPRDAAPFADSAPRTGTEPGPRSASLASLPDTDLAPLGSWPSSSGSP